MSDKKCDHFAAVVYSKRGGWHRERCTACGKAGPWMRPYSAALYQLRPQPEPTTVVVDKAELAALRARVAVPTPVLQIALLVLCQAKDGQTWHSNFLKDFDIAIEGLRAALSTGSETPAGARGEP